MNSMCHKRLSHELTLCSDQEANNFEFAKA